MKRIISCAVALWLGTALIAAQGDSWVKITENKGASEVLFPSKPKVSPMKDGKQYLVEREGGKAALIFAYTDFAQKFDVGNADSVKVMMSTLTKVVQKSLPGSKLLLAKDSKFMDKYPARDVELDVPALGVYKVKIVLTPRKLYQMTILASKEYQESAEAMKFMQSFKTK